MSDTTIRIIIGHLVYTLLTDLRDLPRKAVAAAEAKFGDGNGEIKKEYAVDFVIREVVAHLPDLPHVDEEALVRGIVSGFVEKTVDVLNGFLKPAE